ncbi:MAG: hypothetical protein COA62_15885 [Rhodobiaceae bacterium]|nr:MAG: hypothetical protein COA62_15885 [Rhodobiaceae bacterium]
MSVHQDLVMRGERWLNGVGCKVVVRDPLRTYNREQPDAIGWRDGVSILIECKTSRSDFHSDKKKPFRECPETGMGDWRFYMCPPGVIHPQDLPDGWGLLWAHERIVKRVHGVPTGRGWHRFPNKSDKRCENVILVSALRRLYLRGHLPLIYEPPMDPLA